MSSAVTDDELAELRRGHAEVLDGGAPRHSVPYTTWTTRLLARVDADAKVIAELRAVVGPPMPCGCYAVECERVVSRLICPRYGLDHTAMSADLAVTPEYAEWRRLREGRS